MVDSIKRPIGVVNFEVIKASGEVKIIKANTVLPNARKLIARSIAGESNFKIDTIELYSGGAKVGESTVQHSFPTDQSVKFFTTFAGGELLGTPIDQAILKNSTYGDFSIVVGINIAITSTDKLSVSWEITIL